MQSIMLTRIQTIHTSHTPAVIYLVILYIDTG